MMNRSAEIVQNITSCTSDLLEEFKKQSTSSEEVAGSAVVCYDSFRKRIRDHLQHSCYQFSGRGEVSMKNPVSIEFNSSYEWINTKAPSLSTEAKSKIIILEFFTHCCINCVHSINELRQILSELKNERIGRLGQNGCCVPTDFKLISIHSPKFYREQNPESLRAFVEKMSMEHSAVVNDPNRTLWQNLGIFCWPTILVFGPNPSPSSNELNLLFSIIGEGHGMELKTLLDTSAKYFDEVFDYGTGAADGLAPLSIDKSLPITTPTRTNSLSYPGKVSICGQRLVISDSGNHRIVTSSADGILQEIIGGSGQGYADGDFLHAKFSNPQGIAFESETLFYVADTGNHAIRRIDLMKKEVSTLVPPNATVPVDGEILTLKSPWDLTFYGPHALLIAAAGNHQIFGYFFQSLELFRRLHAKTLFLVAGTGREENRNNSYILKSSFAQPSGISVSNGSPKLVFIADSESSSIRMIDGTGKVVGLAGGSRDPTDLFAFGDQDGIAYDAKLQHPVGVCASDDGSRVFVTDTYNHKVKVIDTATKRCTTLIGDCTTGDCPGSFSNIEPNNQNSSALLNEPGGLCIDATGEILYIADTNNHKVKISSIKNKTVSTLELQWPPDTVDAVPADQDSSTKNPSKVNPLLKVDDTFEVPYYGNAPLRIHLSVKNLPENYEAGEWTLSSSNGPSSSSLQSGQVSKSEGNVGSLIIELVQPTLQEFIIAVRLFFCSESSCYMRILNFLCHLKREKTCSSNENNPVILVHTPGENTFQE